MSRPRTVSSREDLLPLHEGDSAEAVVDLQERLERLGLGADTTDSVYTAPGQQQLCKCSSLNVACALTASAAKRRGRILLRRVSGWAIGSFTAVARCCRETTSPTRNGGSAN